MLHYTASAGWRGSFDSSSAIRLLQWRSRQAPAPGTSARAWEALLQPLAPPRSSGWRERLWHLLQRPLRRRPLLLLPRPLLLDGSRSTARLHRYSRIIIPARSARLRVLSRAALLTCAMHVSMYIAVCAMLAVILTLNISFVAGALHGQPAAKRGGEHSLRRRRAQLMVAASAACCGDKCSLRRRRA